MSGYGSMSGEGKRRHGSDEGRPGAEDGRRRGPGPPTDRAGHRPGARQRVPDDGSAEERVRPTGSAASRQALHQTGDSLQGATRHARAVRAPGGRHRRPDFREQLRTKSVEQLLSEAERFARREPEVFLGGAVLLGLLASTIPEGVGPPNANAEYGYDYRAEYGRSEYGRGDMGRASMIAASCTGEGIDYRTHGHGRLPQHGFDRRTVSFGTTTGSLHGGDINAGRERTSTGRTRPLGLRGASSTTRRGCPKTTRFRAAAPVPARPDLPRRMSDARSMTTVPLGDLFGDLKDQTSRSSRRRSAGED